MSMWRAEVLCSRCKTVMDYVSEVERSDEVKISRFYRCPACGLRILDEKINVKYLDERVLVEVSKPLDRKLYIVRTV